MSTRRSKFETTLLRQTQRSSEHFVSLANPNLTLQSLAKLLKTPALEIYNKSFRHMLSCGHLDFPSEKKKTAVAIHLMACTRQLVSFSVSAHVYVNT